MVRDGVLDATSGEPWLDLAVAVGSLAGRWVDIVYRAGAWDEPARPMFRFHLADGRVVDRIAAAPVAGAGRWSGRVPSGTARIGISPTNRLGPFSFAIERIRARWWPAVVAAGLLRRRKPARSAVLTRLIGWTAEADSNLGWATGSTPLSDFERWHRERCRPLDLAHLDAPRVDWSSAAPIGIAIGDGDRGETLASLDRQILDRWRVIEPDAAISPDIDYVGFVPAGDRLTSTALATLAEQARRRPEVRLFYGDVLIHKREGPRPVFKPGWSPRLQRARPFVEGAAFVRGIATWADEDRRQFLTTGKVPRQFLDGLTAREVLPLRRIMAETVERGASGRPTPAPLSAPPGASASIVIPTRDHPALLRRLLASIEATPTGVHHAIVVVDNGSVGEDAKALNAELARTGVTIIDRPGPFNFSAICNEAAAHCTGDVLVFLNDDMAILSDGWLDRLVAHAIDPTIGAVGAKLTYPDGRLQHVGVLVGMGGSAGHFGAPAPGDDPGWCGRNLVPHEVSAVTGACLAVSREKFEAVGGFDAEHLPIELSDIDLCLKLGERGWQCLVDPCVHLMHEESASRGGAMLRRLDVYAGQRDWFVTRWRHVLRDDPTFHPGLSLYDWRAALG